MRASSRWLWRHTDYIAFLAIVVFIGAYTRGQVAGVDQRARRDAAQTKAALCTLRFDLEQRVDTSQQFLDEHPDGVPGISAATIQESISNQRRTIRALAGLRCPT